MDIAGIDDSEDEATYQWKAVASRSAESGTLEGVDGSSSITWDDDNGPSRGAGTSPDGSVLLAVNPPSAEDESDHRRRLTAIIAGLLFASVLICLGWYLLQTETDLSDRKPSIEEILDDSDSVEPVENGADHFGVAAVGVEGDDQEGSSDRSLFDSERSTAQLQGSSAEQALEEPAPVVVLGTPDEEPEPDNQQESQPTTTTTRPELNDELSMSMPTSSTIINTTKPAIASTTASTAILLPSKPTSVPLANTSSSTTSTSTTVTSSSTSTSISVTTTEPSGDTTTTTTAALPAPPTVGLGNIDITSAGLVLTLASVPAEADRICWMVGLTAADKVLDPRCTTSIADPVVIGADQLELGPARLVAVVYGGDETLFAFKGSAMFWSGDVLDEPVRPVSGDDLVLSSHVRPEITRYCWKILHLGSSSADLCGNEATRTVSLPSLFEDFAGGEVTVYSMVEIGGPVEDYRVAGREESQLTIELTEEGEVPEEDELEDDVVVPSHPLNVTN